jgi:hypothetical protein
MSTNIDFEIGMFGTRAVIKSKWQDYFITYLLDKEVVELELNTGKGWHGDDINFLKYFPQLKSLTVLDQSIKSINAINDLNRLVQLNISTYCNTPINFNNFPDLEECSFEWRNKSDSLFDCSKLRKLGINKFNNKDSLFFSKLVNIEVLTILNSPLENILGFSTLNKLKILTLGNLRKLNSLKGLDGLQNLEELTIQRCKGITSISDIFKLNRLRRLLLLDLGDIKSIKGIERLDNLEDLLFYDSTNIVDGDLSPLFKLTRLINVSFQNRKHYSNRREEFK